MGEILINIVICKIFINITSDLAQLYHHQLPEIHENNSFKKLINGMCAIKSP